MKFLYFIIFLFGNFFLYCEDFQIVEINQNYTLWDVANKYLKDPKKWDIVVKYNNLSPDPNQILKGKKLKIPINLLKEEYIAAHFEKIIGDVRVRGVSRSEWVDASKIKDVFKGDTIRTGSSSYADIKFYTGQVLNLFANSMVVVKPPKVSEDLKLISGQIKAKDTQVITVSAKIVPKVKNTEYSAKVNEDLSTKVEVYKGEAEVEGKGKKVLVKEGFSTEVRLNSEPLIPKKLPELALSNLSNIKINYEIDNNVIKFKPVSVSPDNKVSEIKKESNKNPVSESEVKIDISKAVSGYRIQVAKDKEFKDIIFDRKIDIFKNLNLRDYLSPGSYYFRISYIDLLGYESEFTKPQELVIK